MKYAKSMKIFCRNSDSAMANNSNKTTKYVKKICFSRIRMAFCYPFSSLLQCRLHSFCPLFRAGCAVWFCWFFFPFEMNNNNNFSSIQLFVFWILLVPVLCASYFDVTKIFVQRLAFIVYLNSFMLNLRTCRCC